MSGEKFRPLMQKGTSQVRTMWLRASVLNVVDSVLWGETENPSHVGVSDLLCRSSPVALHVRYVAPTLVARMISF